MHILIVSIEAGRYGPARLPEAFSAHGVKVSALCHPDNILAASELVDRRYALPGNRRLSNLTKALERAVLNSGACFIVPGDEQAVILMHKLMCKRHLALVDERVMKVIAASLGEPERFDATLFKSDTMALARSLGLRVPDGGTVVDHQHAQAMADALSYPVYLKQSFSWAGRGVVQCENANDVLRAFPSQKSWRNLRNLARKCLGLDWYPVESQIDIQKAILGSTAMFCGAAWQGRMLGGYAGKRLEQIYANGPSRSVRISHNQDMADMAAKMIEALGFTGFFSFDFMLPSDGGKPVLIECNPRMVPITHAGRQIGVDQVGLLIECLKGITPPDQFVFAKRTIDLILFPYALSARSDEGRMAKDIPQRDHALVEFVHGGDPVPRHSVV